MLNINMKNRVLCPIINEYIAEMECFDVHMVSEGIAPEFTAPINITCVNDYKETCLKCEKHKE